MELCRLFLPREKSSRHYLSLLSSQGGKNACSRLYEHEELNNTVTLHLLKTYCVSDAFNIQYPLSQKPPKADIGIFSLQRRTLRLKWSRNLPKVTLLPSHICTHVPISVWACFLFFLATLYLHISVHYRSETQSGGNWYRAHFQQILPSDIFCFLLSFIKQDDSFSIPKSLSDFLFPRVAI